jgi:Hsp20/alpha crystallin family
LASKSLFRWAGTRVGEIEAKLTDGVLTVRVPKAEQEARKKIEITTAWPDRDCPFASTRGSGGRHAEH